MDRNISLQQARRKVKSIKAFYYHLAFFVLMSTVLLTIKNNIIDWVFEHGHDVDIEFLKWLDWNIIAIPIIWGAVIVVQGAYVFRFLNHNKKREEQVPG